MRRKLGYLVIGLLAVALLAGVGQGQSAAAATNFPVDIPLPDGWLPEGIVTGHGPVIYSGSRANGAVYVADLRTGAGEILVAGQAGRVAVGMDFDGRSGFLFVAGGATGHAYVYSTATGETLADYTLAAGTPTFVNDVIVTRDAAYFTDSQQPVLYRVPLGAGGRLPAQGEITTIPLTGDYQQVTGFNANGIVATGDGRYLIIVHSTLGLLYHVDAATGHATTIDLGGASVEAGDGLLLRGQTLYVVQNRFNQIAVVELSADWLSGTVVELITSPLFDVPTTIAAHGSRLYVVNARFTTPPTPTTTYNIVQVPR